MGLVKINVAIYEDTFANLKEWLLQYPKVSQSDLIEKLLEDFFIMEELTATRRNREGEQ